MRGLQGWYDAATWRQRYACNAIITGTIYGGYNFFTHGWKSGIASGVFFGAAAGGVITWSGERRLARLAATVGASRQELVDLSEKVRTGKAPTSPPEGAALGRLVAQRRHVLTRNLWPPLVLLLVLFGLLLAMIASTDLGAGYLLTLIALAVVMTLLVIITRRQEKVRLDRMTVLLASRPGPAPTG
jgi:Flp pilus assembly protein TadB